MTANDASLRAFVYVLRCGDGSFYTGYTTDLARRLKKHQNGQGAAYTRSRLPLSLVYCEEFPSATAARKREVAVKALSRSQKEALIAGLLPTPGRPLRADETP